MTEIEKEALAETGQITRLNPEEFGKKLQKELTKFKEIADKWNSIGCTTFQLTPEELKEFLEGQEYA
jgi:hypothetical protein